MQCLHQNTRIIFAIRTYRYNLDQFNWYLDNHKIVPAAQIYWERQLWETLGQLTASLAANTLDSTLQQRTASLTA